jgi:hypothetical protein
VRRVATESYCLDAPRRAASRAGTVTPRAGTVTAVSPARDTGYEIRDKTGSCNVCGTLGDVVIPVFSLPSGQWMRPPVGARSL